MSYRNLISLAIIEMFKKYNCRQVAKIINMPETNVWRYKNNLARIPIEFIYKLEEKNLINVSADIYRLNKSV